jgi:hypothetical protein
MVARTVCLPRSTTTTWFDLADPAHGRGFDRYQGAPAVPDVEQLGPGVVSDVGVAQGIHSADGSKRFAVEGHDRAATFGDPHPMELRQERHPLRFIEPADAPSRHAHGDIDDLERVVSHFARGWLRLQPGPVVPASVALGSSVTAMAFAR